MKFYIYNNNLKAYLSGNFAGMPSWTPLQTKAQSFNCPIEAGDLAWKWRTYGDLVIID